MRLTIRCIVKKEKICYRFIDEIQAPLIVFDRKFSQAETVSYSRLFGVKDTYLKKKVGHFCEDVSEQYQFLDLFSYQGMYYWSVFEENKWQDKKNIIEKSTDIYRQYIEVLKNKDGIFEDGIYEFTIEGNPNLMIDKLARFITHPRNRVRIESIDIYILQLALARLGNSVNMLLLHSKF